MNLKVGDRVKVMSDYHRKDLSGVVGTVVSFSAFIDNKPCVGVEFDFPPLHLSHDLNGTLDKPHGRYFFEEHLIVIEG